MSGKQVMKQLLRFLFQFKLYLLLALACAILSVALNVYAPLLIGDILDAITSNIVLFSCCVSSLFFIPMGNDVFL